MKVTRIKGLQPGFQVVDDPSNQTHITIMPTSSKVKDTKRMEVPSQDSTEVNNIIPRELEETNELEETGNIAPQGDTEGNNIAPEKSEEMGNFAFRMGAPLQDRTEDSNIIPGKLEGTDNISPDKLAVSMHFKIYLFMYLLQRDAGVSCPIIVQ